MRWHCYIILWINIIKNGVLNYQWCKDENKWEKEENTTKLKNAIQEVSRKSMVTLVEWQDTNPDFQDMDSEFSNKCISMTQQCIAGSNRDVYYPKVIRSLAKETMIEKNM